jgi:hypothetical protein
MIRPVAGDEIPGPAHPGRDAAAERGGRTGTGTGVGGGGVSAHKAVLTSVAALVAGAFSMGTEEYVSVTNQAALACPGDQPDSLIGPCASASTASRRR